MYNICIDIEIIYIDKYICIYIIGKLKEKWENGKKTAKKSGWRKKNVKNN